MDCDTIIEVLFKLFRRRYIENEIRNRRLTKRR